MNMTPPPLGRTFSQGVAWFYLMRIGSRLVAIIQLAILARLLSPADFGLMGMAMLMLSLLSTFSTTGYEQALIQKRQDIDDYLDTTWWVEIGRGALLGAAMFLGAPLAAAFFKEQSAVPIIRGLAFLPLINGLASPRLVTLSRELRFRRYVVFQSVQTLLTAAATIGAAVYFRSVMALVIGVLFQGLTYSLGSFVVAPYRPRLRFDLLKARDLWGFGRWVLGEKILHYLFNDGDDWVVGRLLGSRALGYYQNAYNLGNAPATEITAVFSSVAFPVFSKIQEDTDRIRQAYLRLLQVIMFASTPVAVGMALVAQDAVAVIMGEKWLPIVRSMQILLIWGWLRSFRATSGPVLQARGRPDLIAKFTLFKVILLAALVVPFTLRWDIEGTSWAVVIAASAEMPLLVYSLCNEMQMAHKDLLSRLLRPMIACIPMAGCVLAWQLFYNDPGLTILRLAVSIALGSIVFILTSVYLDHKLGWGVMADFRQASEDNLWPIFERLSRVLQKKSASPKQS